MDLADERMLFYERLERARSLLIGAAPIHAALMPLTRALSRLQRIALRPMRIAILGEANSGKSTLANFLIGGAALPAFPAVNTRLPTLIRYGAFPQVVAVNRDGSRFLLPGDEYTMPDLLRCVEVALPSPLLHDVEILDFPASSSPLLALSSHNILDFGVDAAIWSTVATQAWRESERASWLGLPGRLRETGLLAVTHCDLIRTKNDFEKLRMRLKTVAKPYFGEMYFTQLQREGEDSLEEQSNAAKLLADITTMAHRFSSQRLKKAVSVTQRVAGRTLRRIDG